ncbi:aspartate carbamoyltransferase regulatory subunit [Tannockella kyphosi]|uniref:aspartate carbamoyltransferase regulatory subunit n=1 Tax=Tannockella kyphosi TaxID=2899121 RepID=UPI002011F674|nr:aspartate carbamoyltransferase regulatory subunit [Tannockella kyphosi]
MKIDSIVNGIVLDHITAGKVMEVYEALNLDQMDCSVAIMKNVKSNKMGKKDILKIDNDVEVDVDVLGYIDPNITVTIIRNGKAVEKKKLQLPDKVVNVVKCCNPRCITSIEEGLDHIAILTNKQEHIYRCIYCETKINKKST